MFYQLLCVTWVVFQKNVGIKMWNYRIIKKENEYGLYEVFYNDDNEISAHAENPEVVGESPQDILDSLKIMLSDTKKHFDAFYPPKPNDKILEYGKIEFSSFCSEEDMEESEGVDVRDLINDTILDQSLNYPPLSWTDPDIECGFDE